MGCRKKNLLQSGGGQSQSFTNVDKSLNKIFRYLNNQRGKRVCKYCTYGHADWETTIHGVLTPAPDAHNLFRWKELSTLWLNCSPSCLFTKLHFHPHTPTVWRCALQAECIRVSTKDTLFDPNSSFEFLLLNEMQRLHEREEKTWLQLFTALRLLVHKRPNACV